MDFFTRDTGVITVGVTGFAKSKKRRQEIDYFRLLSLTAEQRGGKWRLKDVSTQRVFTGFSESYSAMETGYQMLREASKIIPKGVPEAPLFDLFIAVFEQVNAENIAAWNAYLLANMLDFLGIFHAEDLQQNTTINTKQQKIITFAVATSVDDFMQHIHRITPEDTQKIQQYCERQVGLMR